MYEWQTSAVVPYNTISTFYDRHNLKGRPCFHVHGSFGDVYLQLSHLKHKATHTASPFVVLLDPHYLRLAKKALPPGCSVIGVDTRALNSLLSNLGLIGKGGGLFPTRLLPTIYPLIPELLTTGVLHYGSFLEFLMDIDPIDNLPLIENDVDDLSWAKNYLETLGLPVGSCVLICADNNSQKEFTENFWDLVINAIYKVGLTPCLNDSGASGKNESRVVSRRDITRVKVDPEKAVSIVSACGFYVGGTNGFIGIQSIFNRSAKGVNFINAVGSDGRVVNDRSGERVPIRAFFYKEMYPKTFLNNTLERIISDEADSARVESVFEELVLSNSRS